jgi:hypothetical protein
MNILNEMSALTDLLNTTLSQEMQSTNSSIVSAATASMQKVNTVMQEQNEQDSMELLMNNIGLAVQRRGGQ